MRLLIGIAAASTILLAGCAGLTATALPSKDNELTDDNANGFRYYETSPFLLVYTDGKGGLVSKILYLPDSTKLRTIKPYNFAASNSTTLKFDNGRLVQSKAVVDETVVPTAIISGLEKVASSAIKAANGNNDGIPAPYLFRIYGDANGNWWLNGKDAENDKGQKATIQFVK
jgi:hypothetical protein